MLFLFYVSSCFTPQAKVNNASLIGVGYTQSLRSGRLPNGVILIHINIYIDSILEVASRSILSYHHESSSFSQSCWERLLPETDETPEIREAGGFDPFASIHIVS